MQCIDLTDKFRLAETFDMENAIIYIHGKGGSAAECEHYKPLFPEYDVFGLD